MKTPKRDYITRGGARDIDALIESLKLLRLSATDTRPVCFEIWRDKLPSSVTIPDRGSAIVTYDSDGVTSVEVVDGRGVKFTEPQS